MSRPLPLYPSHPRSPLSPRLALPTVRRVDGRSRVQLVSPRVGRMTRVAPLRLVAVDPGLAHTGILTAEVVDYAQVIPLAGRTVRTAAETPHADRLLAIAHAIREIATIEAGGGSRRLHAVIEDPEGFRAFAGARIRRPGDLHYLGAAFGVALLSLREMRGSPVPPPALTVARVSEWYPRAGRRYARKEQVLARARQELGQRIGRVSEHVCMAWALATWWSCHVAPRIWHEEGVGLSGGSTDGSAGSDAGHRP